MTRLPDSIQVLERGWLSSNNIVFVDGPDAALIDSGYVTHAAQTVALVERALDGRRLTRLLNTHSHSDHIGGNAALQTAFGCAILVPAGIAASIADWDEDALLLSPLGQRAARFAHNGELHAGDTLELGGLSWQLLAVPGHDMEALAFYCAERRLLISGDALWENGFGVIFPELLGDPRGFAGTRATLDLFARLAIDTVIPGHGAPFHDVDGALQRAYSRLDAFERDSDRLARHAIKVMLAFALLERRQLPRAELPEFLAGLSFCMSVNTRHLGYSPDELAAWLITDLLASGSLREADGLLVAAGR